MSGPLAGVRVVELCDELGQLAGKLLADMGAEVIKVEPPGGSPARAVGPFVRDIPGPNRSLNFWYHNTNKRSVVLDLEKDDDRENFRKLAARAEIVIESQAPGYLSGLGLGFEDLSEGNPGLIMCSITPFGQDGPWAQWKSSDLVGLALGGPMRMNGYDPEDAPGAPPIRGHGDQGYNTTCHFAAMGIMAALLHRDATGEGQYIDCAMHEALSCTVEVGMPYWFYKRLDVIRQTGRHAAHRRTEPWLFMARDGRHILCFGVGRDNASWAKVKQWYRSEGFGHQFDDPRFDSPQNRQPGRGNAEAEEIMAETARFIAAHDAEYVYHGGQERDQAWGVVRSPDETLGDQHFWDRGFFVGTRGEGVGEDAVMPGAPYVFSATPWSLRRPAPMLGEHTAEVLAEIG
ncbi:MAG: CoA transferase [Dehalococcoidia bacterium]|nr:CoA transferase [Dehalococcoidia bacterium]NUQ54332.1 CoA transferase [Dehalococcoidia bacterium]